MKVAVLISGDYRTFDLAVKSWEFLKYVDCDIFFSTWSKSEITHRVFGKFDYGQITQDRIEKIIPIKQLSIINEMPSIHNTNKMVLHWKNCINLMLLSGVEYDAIILIRPDLYLKLNKDLFLKEINNLQPDTLYVIGHTKSNNCLTGIQDQMFIGKKNVIEKFLTIEDASYTRKINTHNWLISEFNKVFNSYIDISYTMKYCITRGNVIEDDIAEFDRVREKAKVWWEESDPSGMTIYQG